MDFLALALQTSFLPVVMGPIPEPALGAPGFIVAEGTGEPCRTGDIVAVEFWVRGPDGKELANSEKRGVTHTFVVFGPNSDRLLDVATLGAKVGEQRNLILFAEDWYSPIGPYRLIRQPGPLAVSIRVGQIWRR